MNILSLVFFLFVAAAFLVYYLVPKQAQWLVLLIGSILFYVYATRIGLLILAAETLLVFLLAKRMEEKKEQARKLFCAICVLAAVVMLLLLKYLPDWCGVKTLGQGFFLEGLLMPLGISYYTFMIISYAVDVYREQIPAETNYAKLLLFVLYFPSITQGPLNRYGSLSPQFYEPHAYDAKQIFEGLLRFGWGCFKKLVIANRTAALIAGIYGSKKATGIIIILAFILTQLHLYSDFSGFADMAIGISRMFGIKLPDNFRQPYFSRSIEEFWKRWHITLGTWLKDYIYYPISVSSLAKTFIRGGADRTARKRRTKLVSCIALMILWIVMGVWHGTTVVFLIVGLYYGVIFVAATLLKPVSERFGKEHPKLVASPLYKFWQQARTTLYLWPAPILFSVSGLPQLAGLLQTVFTKFKFESLFDGTLLKFDLDALQIVLLFAGFLTLLIVSVIEYNKKKHICVLVMQQKFFVRVLIYWFVIVMILLSLNIANTEFIYAQF